VHSSNIAGNNVTLNARDNVNITASNDREFKDVHTSYKGIFGSGSSRDMNLKESVVSSSINGNNIAITSGKDTTLQAANLKATENIQVDVAGDINILAQAYREASLHQESKSSFGGLVSSASLDSTDAIKLREATVKTEAKNIIMNSGKDINVVASDMSAGDVLGLKAAQNINVLSDEEKNTEQHYSKKTGLSLGFSDGMLTVAEEKQTQDAKASITQKSATLSGKTVTVEAGQDVTSIGSIIAASAIDINAQRDVNLLSATESANNEHKESIAKAGIGVTLNMNEASLFAGVVTKSDKLGEGQTQEVGSQLVGDNITVQSGNNTNVLASNVVANNDVAIQADKNINILSQDATAYKNQVHEELKAGIKVGVQQHVTDAAKQLASNAQSLPKSDNAVNAASTVLRSIDLVSNTLSHSVSAGFDAIAEMSKNETSSQSTSAQSSTIVAGHDVTLDAANEINVAGSDVVSGNKISMNAEAITLKSSEQTASSSSSDKSGSLKVTLFGTREGQVDASYAQSKNRSNDTIQRDTYVSANDVAITTSGDATLQGAHVSGNTVTANVGGNLNLISVQDTGSSKGDSESISISTAGNVSVGAGKSSSSKAWVNEQTGIIAAEKADITVAKNTDLQGAIIATKDTNGNDVNNVHLTTETLSASDISDHDTSTSMNIARKHLCDHNSKLNSKGTTGEPSKRDTATAIKSRSTVQPSEEERSR
jgi:filamentous hemagglutinin